MSTTKPTAAEMAVLEKLHQGKDPYEGCSSYKDSGSVSRTLNRLRRKNLAFKKSFGPWVNCVGRTVALCNAWEKQAERNST